MVEAVRTGYVIARDKKAAASWAARRAAASGPGLTGADLDKAVRFASARTSGARYVGGRKSDNVKLLN